LETTKLDSTDVKTLRVNNRMPQSNPNWVPPRKFAALAENPLIKDWLVSYPALNTKNEHLKRFGRLIEAIDFTPEEIVTEVKGTIGKQLKAKAKGYCAALIDRGLTATANLTLSSFRSFLISQELTMPWTRQDMITIVAVRTERKVPAKEEIYRMLDGLTADTQLGKERIARYKALLLTAFESGLRPGALLKLKVGDIDLTENSPVPIKVTPGIDSKIRKSLAKIGFYWAFIGREAQMAIQEYLAMRERFGQKLTSDSPLFENFHHRGQPMDIGTWAEVSKRLGRYAGLKRSEISPHSFRHAFRKQVRFFLDDQVATVLAGHKIEGSEEHYFDRKDKDFLRDEYAKVDWSREKTVTASQLNKVTALLEKLGGVEKVEKLLETLAEEEQKPVKRVRG